MVHGIFEPRVTDKGGHTETRTVSLLDTYCTGYDMGTALIEIYQLGLVKWGVDPDEKPVSGTDKVRIYTPTHVSYWEKQTV